MINELAHDTVDKIELNSSQTDFSIGTYGGWLELDLDGEWTYNEVSYYQSEGLLPSDDEIDDWGEWIDTAYNMETYLNDLAEANVDFLNDLVQINETNPEELRGLLWDFTLIPDSAHSPREYNFYTDSHDFTVKYDLNRITNLILDNPKEFDDYIAERWTSRDGFWSLIGRDDVETKVLFALKKISEAVYSEPLHAQIEFLRDQCPEHNYCELILKKQLGD